MRLSTTPLIHRSPRYRRALAWGAVLPLTRWISAWALAALAAAPVQAQSLAQSLVQAMPQNVISLSAEASTEVRQDLLTMVLAATREGADANQVQSQLRETLDAALTLARKSARAGQLEVRTGGFSLYPRYSTKPNGGNSISGWQGRAELVLEGRDTAAISQLAGRLDGLSVARLSFGLSREARDQVEADVADQAIARFKLRAKRYAEAFGFAGYSLREVSVNGADVGGTAAPQMMQVSRAKAMSAAEEVQPVEAGKATVSVSVSGSIQLSPR